MATKRKSKTPISQHPGFPAIVALWFAALLGMGSLVLPVILFEKLVTVTGIASLVPAVAPPLGVTARILIALVAAGLGVAAGLFVARKVIAAQGMQRAPSRTRRAESVQGAVTTKKPISAHEELGEGGLDEPAEYVFEPAPPIPGRKRPLSVTDDSGPSELLESAPLPGNDELWDDQAVDAEPTDTDIEDNPLELAEFAAQDDQEAEPVLENRPVPRPTFGSGGLSILDESQTFDRPSIRRAAEEVEADTQSRPFDSPEGGKVDFAIPAALAGKLAEKPDADAGYNPQSVLTDAAVEESGNVEPEPAPFAQMPAYTPFSNAPFADPQEEAEEPTPEVDFLELQRTLTAEQQSFAPNASDEESEVGDGDEVLSFTVSRAPENSLPSATDPVSVPESDAEGELAELGMSELVERFARSLQQASARAEAETVEIPAPEPEDAQEEAASAPAAPVVPAPYVPTSLRPLDFDVPEDSDANYDEHEAEPAFALPVTPAARPFAAPAAAEAPEEIAACGEIGSEDHDTPDENEGDDFGYSSLLDMKRRFGQEEEFVRIEDDEDDSEQENHSIEPVVVFPGQATRRAMPASNRATSNDAMRPASAAPFAAPAQRAGQAPSFYAPEQQEEPVAEPADPAATERALREALEKLQRMSGAA